MSYDGRVLNLGRGGALVALAGCAIPPPAGAEIEIEVLLERSTTYGPNSIRGRGRIVRVEDAVPPVRVAIEFHAVAFAKAHYYGARAASQGMVV